MQSKFTGSLLGTFAGDILGMPVENWSAEKIAGRFGVLDEPQDAALWLQAYGLTYGLLKDPGHGLGNARLKRGTYTDDTQMMIAVAESLVACKGFDGADMAARFVKSYDPRRGYGPGAAKVIGALARGAHWEEAGRSLFGGTGSFGNGASMRVAPVGLLYHDQPEELRRVAELSASITHAHPIGKEGAALQAYAVACAFNSEAEGFSPQAFLEKLKAFLNPECEPLRQKLELVSKLLSEKPSVSAVVSTLGNDVSADGSVPAAIYAFLANSASFKNAVVYAVSLGGDTDTIGAMTGAIAGAFHGVNAIPTSWMEAMENGLKGRDYVRDMAALLWEQTV